MGHYYSVPYQLAEKQLEVAPDRRVRWNASMPTSESPATALNAQGPPQHQAETCPRVTVEHAEWRRNGDRLAGTDRANTAG